MKILSLVVISLFFGQLSAQSFTIKKKKGLYGVKDKKTKIDIIPYEYDAIEEIGIKEIFFILSKNGKQGIVNSKNEIIFPLSCDSIIPTNKNFAVNYYVYKNGKIGYISIRGFYLPIEYEEIKRVYKQKLIVKKEGKYGVIHTNGEIIYNYEYEYIHSFSDDYLCAKKDGNWVGLRDNKIIHEGKNVLFHNPDVLATCKSCSDIEDAHEKAKCTEKTFNEIIYNNIKYPQKAQTDNKEGIVVVAYTVNENGDITDLKTLRDVDGYFEEECKRLVKLFPKMNPAIHEGQPVKCVMVQPFRFKLK